jgi:hypothetical protein
MRAPPSAYQLILDKSQSGSAFGISRSWGAKWRRFVKGILKFYGRLPNKTPPKLISCAFYGPYTKKLLHAKVMRTIKFGKHRNRGNRLDNKQLIIMRAIKNGNERWSGVWRKSVIKDRWWSVKSPSASFLVHKSKQTIAEDKRNSSHIRKQ